MELETRSPVLMQLVLESAPLERIAGGFRFTEGPVWRGDHLLFTDIPNDRIVRWQQLPEGPEVRTFRAPSAFPDGLTLDLEGRLIACEGSTRRLTRTEANGEITVLAERFDGKRINSPNDVIVASGGLVYFTDPFWFAGPQGFVTRWGLQSLASEEQELPFQGVFRVDLDGRLEVVAEDFERPNGLAFSPDERTLYVDDTRRFHIRAFDVESDGSLTNDRVFAELRGEEPGVLDGMKVDQLGNVYCTGPGGIWIIAATGEILGRLRLPERAANLGWGGADWQTLFITASTSLYRIATEVPGVPVSAR